MVAFRLGNERRLIEYGWVDFPEPIPGTTERRPGATVETVGTGAGASVMFCPSIESVISIVAQCEPRVARFHAAKVTPCILGEEFHRCTKAGRVRPACRITLP